MPPYDQVHEFTAALGGRPIQFISKPGLANWDRVSPASMLLAEAISLTGEEGMLLLGCGHGALGVALARLARQVDMLDVSLIALEMAGLTVHANAASNARVRTSISVLPEQAQAFDVVAIEAPADRGLTRRWLVEAREALRPGGTLYLAGANDQGARSAIADAAALFGGADVLAFRQGSRVAHAGKLAGVPPPAWASTGGIAPGSWHEFAVEVRGHAFRLRSLPGVFSSGRLDEGTALLLGAIDIPRGAHVLDVGCGYGIIGLLAARLGAANVDMVDSNLLAVASAAENIALDGCAVAQIFPRDGVPSEAYRRYDVVATNPPFHAGKATDYDITRGFIDGARRALRPGGRLYLVANRFLKYDGWLRAAFERVDCVAETRSYRVWSAT